MLLAPGTSIGPYTIVTQVGSGGMGVVYRAHDARLSRDVAIKVVSGEIAARPETRLRFEQEARAVAALSHPNIVAIHDVGSFDGVPYAVTELLDGEPLRARIARGALPWREAAELALAIAEGLAAAHARAIVHRDIKPENLFLTADGRLKILDFGLARSTSNAGPAGDEGARPDLATETGIVLGTVGYLSPEQARGEPAGPQSDVFAVGCVIYEMLSGRRAFDGPSGADRLAAVLHATPAPLPALAPDTPAPLVAIVERSLEKAPEHRFADGRALADALRDIVSDSGRARVVAKPRPRAGKALAVLPFELSPPHPDGEFLSDGLTEAIINSLAALPKLRVVPRSTVFRYKGRKDDLAAIGRELAVSRILVGHLTRHGDLLKLQVELIDPARDTQLWGQQYTRTMTDIFALQDELARDVTTALQVRLTAPARRRLTQRQSGSTDAYQDYLRGRYHMARYSPEGFRQAIACFEAAIARDPHYAAAYAELGDAIGTARFFGYAMPGDEMRGRESIERALAIDPRVAEGQAARAKVAMFLDRDFTAAEAAFEEALAIKPDFPECRMFYGFLQLVLGRPDRAAAEARAALELAPLEPLMNAALASLYLLSGHHDAAIAQARRAVSLEPGFLLAHHVLVYASEELQRFEDAIAWMPPLAASAGLGSDAADRLRRAWQAEGTAGYWRERVRLLADAAARRYVPPHLFLYAYAKLGDLDQALTWAERCVAIDAGMLIFLGIDPCVDNLRSDARFIALLERIGLPVIRRTPAGPQLGDPPAARSAGSR